MQPSLSITGSGQSFQVRIGGRAMAQRRFTSHGNAVAALPGIERQLRLASAATRACLCCRAPFRSTGPGHRLCTSCRKGDAHV